jgi:hypothetical protein
VTLALQVRVTVRVGLGVLPVVTIIGPASEARPGPGTMTRPGSQFPVEQVP